jgi:hypothetical protein
MKEWKNVFQSISGTGPLQVQLIERFASHNPWNPNEAQEMAEKISLDIAQYKGNNLLKILDILYVAMEPGRLLSDYFSFFKHFLLSPNDLESVQITSKIVSGCLCAHIEPDSQFQARLTIAERKLLECYVNETHQRWKIFEKVASGVSTQFDKIAMDPSRIPRLEYVIFSFGMAKPLIFYGLLNDLAIDPMTRLHSFMLLKSFLILQVYLK